MLIAGTKPGDRWYRERLLLTEAQLDALDALIAYIDDYYGFESEIIDHKAWRSGNSDTSPEFADYLESYQTKRIHQ